MKDGPTPGRDATAAGATRAASVLVAVTLLWGLSFPWAKDWQNAAAGCPGGPFLAGLTLIGLRMSAAALLLAAGRPRLVLGPTRREHAAGLAVGAAFFVGFALQTWALARTTPALSAFFTSLSSAWVPPLAWLVFGVRVARWTAAGLAVGLAGTLLIVDGNLFLGFGEALTLASSVVFAGQMLLLDRLGKRVRPGHLTAGFFAATGFLGLSTAAVAAALGPGVIAWGDWAGVMLGDPAVLRGLACLTVFSTLLAFHWMNTYQPQVSASRAALIYLLEPVFAAVFSVLQAHEAATAPLLAGGALILVGNVLVELPGWLYARTATAPAE